LRERPLETLRPASVVLVLRLEVASAFQVTAPSLARVQGSGSSRTGLQDQLAGDDLRVELSGASHLDGPVEVGAMTATLSGASTLRYQVAPTFTRQEVSGGSSITRAS
jgi:hypothetical protein